MAAKVQVRTIFGKGCESHLTAKKCIWVAVAASSGVAIHLQREKAGVEFYGNSFLLQISLEKVDSDNDKIADDVKLGVFFNGVLYDNTYIYLVDAADKFGNNIAIIQPDQIPANGRATIKSIKKKVDFY